MSTIQKTLTASLNRLGKWRMVFCGWQLGTRTKEDPEAQALRDHRELTLLLRAEMSAVTGLLLKRGTFTLEEYQAQLTQEADQLNLDYQKRFPGFKADDQGMVMNAAIARDTMAGWKP